VSLLNIHVSPERVLLASDSELIDAAGKISYNTSKFVPLSGSQAVVAFVGDLHLAAGVVAQAVASCKPFPELADTFPAKLDEVYAAVAGASPWITEQPGQFVTLAGWSKSRGMQAYLYSKIGVSRFERTEIHEHYVHPVLSDVSWKPETPEQMAEFADLQARAIHQSLPGIAAGGSVQLCEIRRDGISIRRLHELAPRPWTPAEGCSFEEWRQRHGPPGRSQ
jgi:hypothetical protein